MTGKICKALACACSAISMSWGELQRGLTEGPCPNHREIRPLGCIQRLYDFVPEVWVCSTSLQGKAEPVTRDSGACLEPRLFASPGHGSSCTPQLLFLSLFQPLHSMRSARRGSCDERDRTCHQVVRIAASKEERRPIDRKMGSILCNTDESGCTGVIHARYAVCIKD